MAIANLASGTCSDNVVVTPGHTECTGTHGHSGCDCDGGDGDRDDSGGSDGIIGAWSQGEVLGRGAHGVVRKGVVIRTGQIIAVKQIHTIGIGHAELKVCVILRSCPEGNGVGGGARSDCVGVHLEVNF